MAELEFPPRIDDLSDPAQVRELADWLEELRRHLNTHTSDDNIHN